MTPDDLLQSAIAFRSAIATELDEDWSRPAGALEWDVRTTVGHVADAVGWLAAHLAAAGSSQLRFDFRAHDNASNAQVLDVLDAAAATLAAVTLASRTGSRGFHPFGMADASGFLASAANEILVHCWDVRLGFGLDFDPPVDLAERTVRRLFPWAPDDTPPWPALLWANGRADLPGRPRPPDWTCHPAPLDEWDGTAPYQRLTSSPA